MQRTIRLTQVFDSEQRFAVERRQELDACVDRLEANVARFISFAQNNRARTAIAFGAALFRTGAERVFAQVLEDGARDVCVADFADRVAVVEADRLAHVSVLALVCVAAFLGGVLASRRGCGVVARVFPAGPAAASVTVRKVSLSIFRTHSGEDMAVISLRR